MVITVSLFVFRGLGFILNMAYVQNRVVKILPHVNDTVLLISAIILSVKLEQYPFIHSWLTIKVIALILYIALGFYLFKFAKTTLQKAIGFVSAISVVLFIIWTAITKAQF